MKILFLCGSLEPGRDGVGDYTRRLAGELIRQGYQARIIALFDQYIPATLTKDQWDEAEAIPTVRFPAKLDLKQNLQQAKTLVADFNPDWISLQFVPYAFNGKGLPFSLAGELTKFGKDYKWHIMFHELWIGFSKRQLVKSLVWSYLQKYQIGKMIKQLQPKLIHTHLPIYQSKLKRMGVQARPLLLFSNIKAQEGYKNEKSEAVFKLAFFSQAAISPSIIDFINQFALSVKERGLSPELVLIGGNTAKMRNLVTQFQKELHGLNQVSCTGFLNQIEISKQLADCNLGISPVPQHALGKSGTVAAFLAHGIPVAAPIAHKEHVDSGIGFLLDELRRAIVIKSDWHAFESAKHFALSVPDILTCSLVTRSLLADLKDKPKPQ